MTRRILLVVAALAATAAVVTTVAFATLSPSSAVFTLRPGDATLGTATETKTVGVPVNPPKADVEIAIDTTGSMGPTIAQAKADALAIVSGVSGLGADTRFAVAQFRDAGESPEYALTQPFTNNATDVQNAINSYGAGGGGDAPEAYNVVFDNAPGSGYRADARKFLIVLGDAQPHGNVASQGFAGCIDESGDPHGLVTSNVLGALNAAQITLMMIRQVGPLTSTSLACYQSLAAAGFAGGQGVDGGTNLAGQIVSLIQAAFANYNNVHLEVASAGPAPAAASWISFSPASVGPVPAPSTQTFTLTATVPGGTPAGSYAFDVVALADGTDIGHQALTIVVPEKHLTLSPATASNPIGTSHTVTASVFDSLGPFVGDPVSFSIASGPDAGAGPTVATNGAGHAAFTFTNTPPTPGTDSIAAADGPLSATASKTWFNTPPDCSHVALDVTALWPPNHKLQTITASGATDTDVGDHATLVIDGVTQDESVNGLGDGDTSPDAVLGSPLSAKASVRSERSGLGDGRVYRLHFTATDTHGAACSGVATVGVPHDQGAQPVAIDSAPPSFNSLLP